MALPEHEFHAKEPTSNEKSVPIPLLNEEKANGLVESELPAPMRKNIITPVELPVVKFSAGLPEHSFHPDEPDSDKKFVHIPLLNEVGGVPHPRALHGLCDAALAVPAGVDVECVVPLPRPLHRLRDAALAAPPGIDRALGLQLPILAFPLRLERVRLLGCEALGSQRRECRKRGAAEEADTCGDVFAVAFLWTRILLAYFDPTPYLY
ncbi:hypothetical protein B0H11DRAFT_2221965 [Mycena galericulata]|nr:hypothetical protein B0H11DRAFT_2221965 [Mycena galericulata]